MATYSKIQLSGGTTGKNIKVAATATAGTLIHTSDPTALDEIWLWAVNDHTADLLLTIEFGGVASPDDLSRMTIPTRDGPYLIIPGWTLKNSLVIRAFCASANLVLINGYVNRIT